VFRPPIRILPNSANGSHRESPNDGPGSVTNPRTFGTHVGRNNAGAVARARRADDYFGMTTHPKSPKEMTNGMIYFPRMLDKIRLHARGELHEDYHKNLGATRAADGACCNFLRVNYADLRDRVLQGGTDEEILDWCFEKGRRLNEGDLIVWNGFASKLGWRDFATSVLEAAKKRAGVSSRDDIATIPDFIDFDEERIS
jgi:hypothetical protein